MRTTIRKEEIVVPQGAFAAVAGVITEHDLDHQITDSDDSEGEESITISVSYSKDERDAFHQIEDIISEYEHRDRDEDDDDE